MAEFRPLAKNMRPTLAVALLLRRKLWTRSPTKETMESKSNCFRRRVVGINHISGRNTRPILAVALLLRGKLWAQSSAALVVGSSHICEWYVLYEFS
jgi:hypothetical protein